MKSPADNPDSQHAVQVVSLNELKLVLGDTNAAQNPAFAYLRSLGSDKSRQTMYSFLSNVARLMDQESITLCRWGALRRHHIHAVIALLRGSDKAPATINTYLSALKGVALEAWTLGQMDTDSFQHIKLMKSVKGFRLPKGRSLQREEIGSLLQICAADSEPKGLRDAAIIAVLIGCGLRRSEIVALNYEDVNFHEQSLRVLGKGNNERYAFVPPTSWKLLNDYLNEQRGNTAGALFMRIRRFGQLTAQRLTDQAIYHILEERRLQAGIESFAPHDLRRSFATIMLENGEDIITLKDAMGHASVMTTQRYDRRSDQRLKDAAKRFDL